MIQPIPAIDILGGKCVRLEKGDYRQSCIFSHSPVDVAIRWVEQAAPMLHLVDLDGAKKGKPVNFQVIKEIVRSVSVPVEVGGGIRNIQHFYQYLEIGVQRVILGSIAFQEPKIISHMLRSSPESVVVSIDQRKGKIAIEGWTKTTSLSAPEAAKEFSQLGVQHFVYTDTERDGTLQGFDVPALRGFLDTSGVRVIVAGGIATIQDIINLKSLDGKIEGIILGKALYSGTLQLSEALNILREE